MTQLNQNLDTMLERLLNQTAALTMRLKAPFEAEIQIAGGEINYASYDTLAGIDALEQWLILPWITTQDTTGNRHKANIDLRVEGLHDLQRNAHALRELYNASFKEIGHLPLRNVALMQRLVTVACANPEEFDAAAARASEIGGLIRELSAVTPVMGELRSINCESSATQFTHARQKYGTWLIADSDTNQFENQKTFRKVLETLRPNFL